MPMTIPLNRAEPCAQRGVMLLEALISIAIFSIAVLGLIGLQSAAIKNANEARQRAVAAFYANQIVGQMWMDHENLSRYQYKENNEPSTSKCEFEGNALEYVPRDEWLSTVQEGLYGSTATGLQQITVSLDKDDPVKDKIVKVTLCWKNPQESVFHWFSTFAQIKGPQG